MRLPRAFFGYLNLWDLYPCRGVAVHASFVYFEFGTPVFMASKLFRCFCESIYHFEEMDFAHLERPIPEMEQDIYDLVLLNWGEFQFLPRNCLNHGPFEEMIGSLFLQNTKIAKLDEIRKYRKMHEPLPYNILPLPYNITQNL
jgi:hypothetical protein